MSCVAPSTTASPKAYPATIATPIAEAPIAARSGPMTTAVRTIERDGSLLRVGVYGSSPSPPRLRDYGPDSVTGRGLLLVDRIARRWGVEMNGNGKCVWFEVDPADQDRVGAGG